jgi:uncharacterized membrane protein YkoI
MALGSKRTLGKALAGIGLVCAVGAGSAFANVDDDASEEQLTGAALERASAAALAETGGGEVTATEVENDSESAYEVEVTLDNGRAVEVELDADFKVVQAERDDVDDADDADEVGDVADLDDLGALDD